MANIDDISMRELKEKAKIIAEGTGRSYESVLEDLLDDGVVNLSNEQRKDGSLVDQLKEAAELIAAVQQINHQVADNTVLNGKDTKTEVNVESTLEGDIIDRAIDSVQRKADNIKKILLTLAPVFLLLTGGSLEAIGITDFLGSDGDDYEDDTYYVEYGGCLAADAANYDPDASWDDGSCWWEDNNGGGGGPPDCFEDWRWDNVVIRDFDSNGEGFNNDIEVNLLFNDWNKCNRHMEQGFFEIKIIDDATGNDYDLWSSYENFHDQYSISHYVSDVPEGEYRVQVDYYLEGSHWSGPSALINIESQTCDHDIVVDQLVLSANADDLNLYVEYRDNNDCGAEIEMQLTLYKNDQYQDYFIVSNNYYVQDIGMTYFNVNQDDSDLLRDVEDGDWKVEFRWWITDEEENCCDMTNSVTVDQIPDLVPCDADIDNLQISVVDDSVSVIFYIAQHEGTDCSDWDIEIELLPQDTGIDSLIHEHGISASSNYYAHTFDEVGNAVWKANVVILQNENCDQYCDIADEETDWITVSYSDEPDEPCDVEIINHYRGHVAEDAEQDAILVAFRVVPTSSCDGVEIDLELFQNGYEANYSTYFSIDGSEAQDFSHTFDGVAIGNSWTPRVTAYDVEDDSQIAQIMMWGIDIVEPEPETCEIVLYAIQLITNATHATVNYDLDCGTETNDLQGYNVTVEFLIYQVNATAGDTPVANAQTTCYIEGYTGDMKTQSLTNFSDGNTTHYDVYFYAFYTDADGQQQYIEQRWLNREMNP